MTPTQSCASCAASTSPTTAKNSVRDAWSHSDHIKRESRHIFNKLHSIAHDSDFIRHIHKLYPSLLVTANLRCGAWYTDPVVTSAVSYFKSTDGHTHQWSFSLKRSNLHLVADIVQARGAVVVDSTRRGKSMPDALSKTVPIWCAVLNLASEKKYGCPAAAGKGMGLETPRWMVPPTEHDQIEARIDGFVHTLLCSDLEVPKLDKPLRPVFVTPQTELSSLESAVQDAGLDKCLPIVLVSASRLVSDSAKLGRDATNECRGENRDEYVYVQGAGDDHENWARGLTPDLFWKHRAALLACEKDQLEAMVDDLVAREATSAAGSAHWFTPLASKRHAGGTENVDSGLDQEQGGDVEVGETGLFVGVRSANHTFSNAERQQYDLVVHFTTTPSPPKAPSEGIFDNLSSLSFASHPCLARVHCVNLAPNKKGLLAIRTVFPPVINLTHRTLTAPTQTAGGRSKVLICCQDGKDLSASLVVAILASCFTDQRTLICNTEHKKRHAQEISKDTTKRRLQWLVSANPRAAPSRAFLLRVNELLLSHPHKPAPRTT